ncbi:MAG: hypothetical protein KDD46_07415 [Bdellovibrionales bacterium]|nr:hypothetical protein [Bdellovibrionales bacterium]
MSKMQRLIWVLIVSCSVHASAQGDISTTDLSSDFFKTGVGLSMGGAYRAMATSTQAILYNPAGMRQNIGTLMITGDYTYNNAYDSGHLYGISVIDTQTSQNAAYGLSFQQSRPSFGGVDAKNNQIIMAIAHQVGAFYTGGSIKGYWVTVDNPNIDGPKGVDMDLGLMFRPSEMISVGFTGYNLIRGHKIEEYPFQLAGGAALTLIPQVTLTADVVKNFNTLATEDINLHFGGRILVNDQIAVRGGYAKDRIFNNDYYGVGFSILAKQAQIHLAFGQTIDPKTEIFSVSLEYRM